MQFDKEDLQMIATLKAEVEQLKKDREEDHKVIQKLQRWYDRCTMGALIWASICAAGMAAVSFVVSNFDKLKYFFAGKQ